MSKTHATSQTREWEQARRTAFIQDALATFTQRPADLLPFEEVRQKLQLSNVRYLGLQDVPLDHIVGSVGRYQDFTRAFFPRRDDLQDRWRRIDRLVSKLPGVELAGNGYRGVGIPHCIHTGQRASERLVAALRRTSQPRM